MAMEFLRDTKKPETYNAWSEFKESFGNLGFKQIGRGAYSTVYQVEDMCVKLSLNENFNNFRAIRSHAAFKKYAPPIYWIHQDGFAILCKLVRVRQATRSYTAHNELRRQVESDLESLGMDANDLHRDNLMREYKTKRLLVVDYGCFMC